MHVEVLVGRDGRVLKDRLGRKYVSGKTYAITLHPQFSNTVFTETLVQWRKRMGIKKKT